MGIGKIVDELINRVFAVFVELPNLSDIFAGPLLRLITMLLLIPFLLIILGV